MEKCLIATLAQKLLDDGSAEQTQKSQGLIKNIMMLVLFTVIISIVLALIISKIISKPIIKLSHVVDIIAQGDLTVDGIHIKNRDEVGGKLI
ncbi:MAG: HAMP domain-containing protein [Caulobacteraceae bacterium]